MLIRRTKLQGVFAIELEEQPDERGFFARTWCQREFEDEGLDSRIVQCSVSFNLRKGTLRGMHYQDEPHPEAKLVRCTMGAVFDVVLDLRAHSPSLHEWIGLTLSSKNRTMIFIPAGCAHGFLTLQDETEVFYQMSERYYPHLSRGVRWDDPAFQIQWPGDVMVISERDRTYPDYVITR